MFPSVSKSSPPTTHRVRLRSDGSGSPAGLIRVLHVDDDDGLQELTATFLERESDAIEVTTADDGDAALEALAGEPYDCVVSDYEMPGMDGLDLLQAVRREYPDLPFILFTGKGSEEIASEAISAGVTDYLQKRGTEQYEVLAQRIENAVGRTRMADRLSESRRRQQRLLDNLPGLAYRAVADPPWPMEFVGGSAESVTGYPAEAFESGRVTFGDDLILEADLDQVARIVERAVRRGEPFEVTYRIRTRSGERRHVWEQATPVFEDGEVVALEGIVLDVTDQERRKRRLRRWQTLGQGALDTCETPLFTCDRDGGLVHVNTAVGELLGRSDTEPDRGVPVDSLATQATRERLMSALEEVVAAREPQSFEFAFAAADGGPVPVTATATPVVDTDGVVGVAVRCEPE